MTGALDFDCLAFFKEDRRAGGRRDRDPPSRSRSARRALPRVAQLTRGTPGSPMQPLYRGSGTRSVYIASSSGDGGDDDRLPLGHLDPEFNHSEGQMFTNSLSASDRRLAHLEAVPQEVQHESAVVKIDAANRLHLIASALGPQKTIEELIPYVAQALGAGAMAEAFFAGLPPSRLTASELELRDLLLQARGALLQAAAVAERLLPGAGAVPLQAWVDRRMPGHALRATAGGGRVTLAAGGAPAERRGLYGGGPAAGGQGTEALRPAEPQLLARPVPKALPRARGGSGSATAAEAFFGQLPRDSFTQAEEGLRSALRGLLARRGPLPVPHAAADPRVALAAEAALMRAVVLEHWVERRIGGEVQVILDEGGGRVFQLLDEPGLGEGSEEEEEGDDDATARDENIVDDVGDHGHAYLGGSEMHASARPPEVVPVREQPPVALHVSLTPADRCEDYAYVFMTEGDDEPTLQGPLEERARKKTRRGNSHYSAEATERRERRRAEVEHERRTRTCGCPPWQDHQPGCHVTARALSPRSCSACLPAPGRANTEPRVEVRSEQPAADPAEPAKRKRQHRGTNRRGASAAARRAARREQVEHERRTRSCGCPPHLPHQPDCPEGLHEP
ncbi:unnamed protein product [Prorocentrum cordatum]|uniref:Uncharacterized protein n=1 Tax=Prorocentrum cordatum TaxID=2364126 RepID=A0ABN9WDM2_9DINO|nr:unnamed protein product [Polarella glacialis]